MKFDSACIQSEIIDFTASTCVSSSGPASISMTDGDPDVFLTASYLRDVLRHMLFIKTTPVCLSVCGIFKYFAQTPITHIQNWCHHFVISVPNIISYKFDCDYILCPKTKSCALEFKITNRKLNSTRF